MTYTVTDKRDWNAATKSEQIVAKFFEIGNAYEIKDSLKGLGYSFNGLHKTWAIECADNAAIITEVVRLYENKVLTTEEQYIDICRNSQLNKIMETASDEQMDRICDVIDGIA